MTNPLSHLRALCFDFDGVFYDGGSLNNFYALCDQVMAQAACNLLGDAMSYEQAHFLAKNGYAQHGDSITAFCHWAMENGVSPEAFRDELFRKYHRDLRAYVINDTPDAFTDRRDLQQAFDLVGNRMTHGVATHSCAQNWANPFLQSMGIHHRFNASAIFGYDAANYTLKHVNPALVRMCFNALGVGMDEGGFVEDSARNLKAAKEHHPELTTILIHHGRSEKQLPSYIDAQFHDVAELMVAIHESHRAGPQLILP